MALYTVTRSKHATLAGTAIDTVTVTGSSKMVDVINRSGTTDLTVVAANGSTPANPTALADNTEVVPVGGKVTFINGAGDFVCKILGNGNAYSVVGS
jgi:hypothetical protein